MSDFTNRELELMFKAIADKLDTHQLANCEKLEAIHEQAITTNGRVRALEQWRWGLAGGITVLTAIVVPMLIKMLDWVK